MLWPPRPGLNGLCPGPGLRGLPSLPPSLRVRFVLWGKAGVRAGGGALCTGPWVCFPWQGPVLACEGGRDEGSPPFSGVRISELGAQQPQAPRRDPARLSGRQQGAAALPGVEHGPCLSPFQQTPADGCD